MNTKQRDPTLLGKLSVNILTVYRWQKQKDVPANSLIYKSSISKLIVALVKFLHCDRRKHDKKCLEVI